jgi:hypothetical protein
MKGNQFWIHTNKLSRTALKATAIGPHGFLSGSSKWATGALMVPGRTTADVELISICFCEQEYRKIPLVNQGKLKHISNLKLTDRKQGDIDST